MGWFDWLFGKRDRGPVTEKGRRDREADQGVLRDPGNRPREVEPQPAKPGLLDRLTPKGKGRTLDELADRLGMTVAELKRAQPSYRAFTIAKRSGGQRRILAPSPELKKLQRLILRRVLAKLRAHPAAMGFERGRSIATHAALHAGADTVVRMDIEDFFPSVTASRVRDYFRKIGWNRQAAALLVDLCTYQDRLPQGAPTSPRLSNLVNRRIDVRLTALARKLGAVYSRYADDLTFSFAEHEAGRVERLIKLARRIAGDEGYRVHRRKKLSVRRRYQRQVVTGLVVNESPRLSRERRRWLRAVEHRAKTGRPTTITSTQLEGWKALQNMVERQGG